MASWFRLILKEHRGNECPKAHRVIVFTECERTTLELKNKHSTLRHPTKYSCDQRIFYSISACLFSWDTNKLSILGPKAARWMDGWMESLIDLSLIDFLCPLQNALDSFPELSVVTELTTDGETPTFKVRLSGKAYNRKTMKPAKSPIKPPLVSCMIKPFRSI